MLPAPRVTYGCFGEALILALEGRREAYSLGRGRIAPEAMDEIMRLGRRHGFEVEPFYLGRERITPERVAAFAKAHR